MLTELEKKVIASIQEDIPVTERPYFELAEKGVERAQKFGPETYRRNMLNFFKNVFKT